MPLRLDALLEWTARPLARGREYRYHLSPELNRLLLSCCSLDKSSRYRTGFRIV